MSSRSEFELLPHIGEVRSKAIADHRNKNGNFKTLGSLVDVDGIGVKTLQKIMPYIKLSGKSDLAIIENLETSSGRGAVLDIEDGKGVTLLGNELFFPSLMKSIAEAKKEVVVSMFLFKASDYSSNFASKLINALTDASERKVAVSVFLEKGKSDKDSVTKENRISAEKLRKKGVEVIFDTPGRTTHTKTIVIDRETVFLGSHNFTHSALKYNNELSVRIDSKPFAEDVLSYINLIKGTT